MKAEIAHLIQEFEQFNRFVQSLEKTEDDYFFKSIKKGKWSPAEIISHITYWNRYILDDLLPKMKQGANVTSVAFDEINIPAAKYALSGVTKMQLIHEQIESRNNLIQVLKEKSDEVFFAEFKLNGEAMDQYSGYPHTMFHYIRVFVWHDNHHRAQIEQFFHSHLTLHHDRKELAWIKE
ncbi:DinB family protein [Virgibacillus soli]|uniref:DinB family protein n=1 Tax=Paracerasibacillus soli TaxID=480284 RepID=A0ABU5CPD5_9BACI|nr:DinB family protein [Virgibacillus soli]MDY0407756.1 DinB family protein [Virgibacillus soli]